jgi:hypothetical protein
MQKGQIGLVNIDAGESERRTEQQKCNGATDFYHLNGPSFVRGSYVARRLSLTDDPHPEERPFGRVSKDGSGQSWFETALRSASSPRGSSPGSPPVPKLFVRCQSIKASAKYLRKTSDLPPNPPQQLHIYRTGRTPTCSGSRRLYPKMIGDEFLD